MNEFEQRLSRVPGKPIPAEWRAEILAAAEPVRPAPARGSWLARLKEQLHAALWPHPQAWAGLAAVWVVVLLLQMSVRDEPPGRVQKSAPPSPAMRVELRQQRQLLVELLGTPEARDADRPRTVSPRTQSVQVMMG